MEFSRQVILEGLSGPCATSGAFCRATQDAGLPPFQGDFGGAHLELKRRLVQGNRAEDEAVRLQHAFNFRATGSPKLPEIPRTPVFELESLPGVIECIPGRM